MSERNRRVIERIVNEVFNNNRVELIDELYADDLCSSDTVTGTKSGCKDDLRATVTYYRKAFPNHQYTLEDIVCDGEKVAIRWTVRGTGSRKVGNVEESNKPYEFEGMSFCWMRDGKVERIWQQFDTASFSRQLGFEAMSTA